jgi:hypothetical protein
VSSELAGVGVIHGGEVLDGSKEYNRVQEAPLLTSLWIALPGMIKHMHAGEWQTPLSNVM